jgi:hypothetical protein
MNSLKVNKGIKFNKRLAGWFLNKQRLSAFQDLRGDEKWAEGEAETKIPLTASSPRTSPNDVVAMT